MMAELITLVDCIFYEFKVVLLVTLVNNLSKGTADHPAIGEPSECNHPKVFDKWRRKCILLSGYKSMF
jgi:hypothetical protein